MNHRKATYIILSALLFLFIGLLYVLLTNSKPTLTPPQTSQDNSSLPTDYTKIPFPTALPPVKIITTQDLASTSLGTVSFNWDAGVLPSLSRVFQVRNSQSFLDIQDFIHSFGVLKQPQVVTDAYNGEIDIWSTTDGATQITYIKKTGAVNLVTTKKTQNTTEIHTKEEAAILAATFLHAHLSSYPQDLVTNTDGILFIHNAGGDAETVDTIDDADAILVPFQRVIDGKTVYFQHGDSASASVTVNKNGYITQMSFTYSPLANSQRYALLPLDSIKDKILHNQFTLVTLGKEDEPQITGIYATTLTHIEQSFLDDHTGFIQPIFVVTGTAYAKQGLKAITLYIPAIFTNSN